MRNDTQTNDLSVCLGVAGVASAKVVDLNNYRAEAEQFYRRTLAIREMTLGHDHPSVGEILENLVDLLRWKGNMLRRKGNGMEAESLLQETGSLYGRSLAIAEKAPGTEAHHIAHLLHKFAFTLGTLGDFATAEPLYRRTLAIREKSHGQEDGFSRAIRSNLLNLLKANGS